MFSLTPAQHRNTSEEYNAEPPAGVSSSSSSSSSSRLLSLMWVHNQRSTVLRAGAKAKQLISRRQLSTFRLDLQNTCAILIHLYSYISHIHSLHTMLSQSVTRAYTHSCTLAHSSLAQSPSPDRPPPRHRPAPRSRRPPTRPARGARPPTSAKLLKFSMCC